MPLDPRNQSYLESLARRGDTSAQALLFSLSAEEDGGAASLLNLVNVAAKGTTDVAAALAGNSATHDLTLAGGAAALLLAAPRNVRAVFAASYDGGNITVTGYNQFGASQTEVITAVANSTVVGVKVWKSITSIVKGAVGAAAAAVSIGSGDKLAFPKKLSNEFVTMTSQADAGGYSAETVASVDVANSAFTPTNLPSGTRDYRAIYYSIP